jgi:hypothetical protein
MFVIGNNEIILILLFSLEEYFLLYFLGFLNCYEEVVIGKVGGCSHSSSVVERTILPAKRMRERPSHVAVWVSGDPNYVGCTGTHEEKKPSNHKEHSASR